MADPPLQQVMYHKHKHKDKINTHTQIHLNNGDRPKCKIPATEKHAPNCPLQILNALCMHVTAPENENSPFNHWASTR